MIVSGVTIQGGPKKRRPEKQYGCPLRRTYVGRPKKLQQQNDQNPTDINDFAQLIEIFTVKFESNL